MLDAALQYQPYMFTKAFVTQIITPSFAGNPSGIVSSQTWAAGIMIHHIAIYNAVFASIQLLIAIGILWPRTTKAGLALSIVWAVGVWWFGEGLGGVFISVSPLSGAPGGVILYALIALLIWPARRRESGEAVAASGLLGKWPGRVAWLVLWGSFVYFLGLPASRSAGSLHNIFAGMTSGEPGWLAGFDRDAAGAVAGLGTPIAVVLAACCALVAVSIFLPRLTRPGIILAVAIGLLIWLAEDFGEVFTGTGTDPNSGPLLILLALTFWPFASDRVRGSTPSRYEGPGSGLRGPA